MNVAIVVEGVIAKIPKTDHFPEASLVAEGRALQGSLGAMLRVHLFSSYPEDLVQHWLQTHGVRDSEYQSLTCSQPPYGGRLDQLQRATANGSRPQLFISANPREVHQAILLGIPSLFFCHPLYQRPEFRPDADHTITEWSVLQAEVERQNALKAAQEDAEGSRFE